MAAEEYRDVASAQQAMASRIEHTYTPAANNVAAFELLYQRYLRWAGQSEALYAATPEEA
ncbi:ribulokinase [compost metagenome]